MEMAVLVCIFTILISIYLCFKWKYSYWQRKKIPYVHPRIPFGTPDNQFSAKIHLGVALRAPYTEFKNQHHKHGGLYWFVKPIYMLVHPEYIKRILVKDFHYFTDRGLYYNEKDDPLGFHLFNIDGASWNKIRTKLTPTFTSGKMKSMFSLLENCGNELKIAIDDYCDKEEPVDIKDILECFTTDVIGSCAFGIECNSFRNPRNDFKKYCIKFMRYLGFQTLKTAFATSYPQLAKRLKFRLVPTDIREFFLNVVINTISYRETNNIIRNDFLNLLMKLRKSEDNEDGLTLTEIAAEAFVFFIAGFETSSTTMSFCLYELACNEDIQRKLRKELFETLVTDNQSFSYETITKMKYLDQVIHESLRKYPPIPYLTRRCVKDYKILYTNSIIDKGTMVVIPTYALHHDSDFYPNPDNFNPERFSSKTKEEIPPFAYLPFGEGPRNCIGLRFGLLQVKLGLAILVLNFKFNLNAKTETPLKFQRQGLFLHSRDKIWLNVKKVNWN